MNTAIYTLTALLLATASSCDDQAGQSQQMRATDSSAAFDPDSPYVDTPLVPLDDPDTVSRDSTLQQYLPGKPIDTKQVRPGQVVAFARTLVGVPYQFASADPR